MGLQHYTQDTSEIPLKYHKRVLFYTKYTHPTLICGGTDGRKIFTQYSGISSCSLGSMDILNFLVELSHIKSCRIFQQIFGRKKSFFSTKEYKEERDSSSPRNQGTLKKCLIFFFPLVKFHSRILIK